MDEQDIALLAIYTKVHLNLIFRDQIRYVEKI